MRWKPDLVQTETPQQYDPAEDPDTGTATTPEEVERDEQRDQAEGGDEREQSAAT